MVKKIAPGWHGWMHYMYDDPPKDDNFVNPFYRNHRTPVFKTDHPELAYKNKGHLLNWDRQNAIAEGRERMYTAWEPPTGDEERIGRKICKEKAVNDGSAHKD